MAKGSNSGLWLLHVCRIAIAPRGSNTAAAVKLAVLEKQIGSASKLLKPNPNAESGPADRPWDRTLPPSANENDTD
jgi:hypothetical protein